MKVRKKRKNIARDLMQSLVLIYKMQMPNAATVAFLSVTQMMRLAIERCVPVVYRKYSLHLFLMVKTMMSVPRACTNSTPPAANIDQNIFVESLSV